MKIKIKLVAIIFALIISSCATKMNNPDTKLYNITWELEYISGPRIAFNGLYPEKKPKISLIKKLGKSPVIIVVMAI